MREMIQLDQEMLGGGRNATLAKTRERLSLQLSSGQLEDRYMSSLGPSEGGSPKVLGRKRVIPSELCIDKGRHHSAFHNSVNNAHKNRKKKPETSKFLKTKKERMS